MRIRIIPFLAVFLILLCSSCIRSFAPDVERYTDLLVVDGGISDAPGPYTIKLSRSTRLQEKPKYIAYSKCNISIEDNIGNLVNLWESAPGIYQTDSLAMRGVAGRKYKLHIATPEGDIYESAEELLLKPAAIQSVYYELQHKSDPQLFFGRDGLQFYVDADVPDSPGSFLMWELQCTYKFRTDLLIYQYYANGRRYLVRDEDTLKFCYRTKDIPDLFVYDPKQSSKSEVKKVHLNFEDNYTKALSIRYSLKVSQFTINQPAYNYWNTIRELRDKQGELYTAQPYQVKNNLVNRTNPLKPALGYFTVAGLSEKRIFVDRPLITDRYEVCTVVGMPEKNMDARLAVKPELWPYFLVDPAENGGDHWIDQDCLDCRRTGDIKKPSFWVE